MYHYTQPRPWYQDPDQQRTVEDMDFAEMENRPCGGGAGAVVWAAGSVAVSIGMVIGTAIYYFTGGSYQ